MKRLTILATLLFAAVSVSAQDYHIKLWDNTTAPTSNGVTGDEYERKPGTLTNTSSAEIWIYKPAPEKATGQAIVFCPGGGYSQLSIANGHNTCKWFAENGIVGVMLKYRLPNGHSEVPLDDLDKAVATVREMAGELGVDPHKVEMCIRDSSTTTAVSRRKLPAWTTSSIREESITRRKI